MQILNTLNVPYETVNILEDELLRSGMKEYSQWPTFPQVYIDGEFYGGADIMIGWHLFARQSDKILMHVFVVSIQIVLQRLTLMEN